MKIASILGLNARSGLYLQQFNPRNARKVADSKLITKRIFTKANLPIPSIYAKFSSPNDVFDFKWSELPSSFALKPSRGLGGEGIIVVKKRLKDGWLTTQKTFLNIEDLNLHTLDILEGAFSLGNFPDVAYIEEFVGRHKAFRKYAYRGTPDIRVIVFNKIPVMAMLRLPTKESEGRANLHQGAIGVGIDIATGITTYAVWHGSEIKLKPGTQRKLNGIKIPFWTKILEIAVASQVASGLGYLGVDLVLHPDKGPLILEINARPGLQIQLANKAGLKKRLERIEGLEVRDPEHGVKIAKSLFAERFADRVAAEEGIKTLNIWESVKVVSDKGDKVVINAKIDTGAWRTSIDYDLAESMGLLKQSNVLWTKKVSSSFGQESRKFINMTFYLAGRKVKTLGSVAHRSHLKTPLIIGRRDLIGFLVKPYQ